MTKPIDNRVYLKKKLFRFDCTKDTSIKNHVDWFNKIISSLESLEVEMDDKDKVILLLNSLIDSY